MADLMQQAEDQLGEDTPRTLLSPVDTAQLQGTFNIHLKVNPDLPFDRDTLTQLGQMFMPILLQRYPIGARLLFKKMWEIYGQQDFDQLWPEVVAMLETQRLMAAILQQALAAQQQQQGQQGQQQAAQQDAQQGVQANAVQQHAQTISAHAGAMAEAHGAQQTMHQNEMKTAQQYVRLLQQIQQLTQQGQSDQENG